MWCAWLVLPDFLRLLSWNPQNTTTTTLVYDGYFKSSKRLYVRVQRRATVVGNDHKMKSEGIEGCERFLSPGKGRGVRATQHFQVGDLVFACPAYSYVLTVNERGGRCEFCFTRYPGWCWSVGCVRRFFQMGVVFDPRVLSPVCMVVTCFLRRDGLSKCGKCKQAYYCNVECQVGLEDVSLYALTEFAVPATWHIWLCSVCIQFFFGNSAEVAFSFPASYSSSTLNDCRYLKAPLEGLDLN